MPSQIEEDGNEVFIPIKDMRHCGKRLKVIDGFWCCQNCGVSFDINLTTGRRTTIATENLKK